MADIQRTEPSWVATYAEYCGYWFTDYGAEYEAAVNSLLSRSWPRIQLALQSSGQSNCQLGTGMEDMLREIHIILSQLMNNIPGFRITADQREQYGTMVNNVLEGLANGTLRVCAGDSNTTVPAYGRIVNYG